MTAIDLQSRGIAQRGEEIYIGLKSALEPRFNGIYIVIDPDQNNFTLLEEYPGIRDVMPDGRLLYFRTVGHHALDPIDMYCLKVMARKRTLNAVLNRCKSHRKCS